MNMQSNAGGLKGRLAAATFALMAAVATVGCQTVAEDTIRVGTYNIRVGRDSTNGSDKANSWYFRKADMVATIKKMDLDVFGLQEVTPLQLRYLQAHMPEFEYVGEHRNADRVSGEASPVAYRKSRFDALKKGTFWLSETPDVPGVKGWGAACPRVCSYLILREKTSGKTFCFANTHTDHRSKLAREKGMLLIIERMKKFGAGAPIVFTGDHNCRETEEPAVAVSKILKNAMYVSETPPAGSWRTFNGWRWREREVPAVEALSRSAGSRNKWRQHPDLTGADRGKAEILDNTFYEKCGGPRIDYIYVSPGVRVLDYATVNDARPGEKRYPSDHFPITATVVLP